MDDFFDSIINSQRQFNNLQLDTCKVNTLEHFWRLKAVSFKYGAGITAFTWESCRLTKAEVSTLLNFLPNLVSLSAIGWKLRAELYDEPDQVLNLQRLLTLKVMKCDQAMVNFFTTSLPENIVKDLSVNGEPESLLRHQQTVEKLELTVDDFNHDDLRNMKLKHLTLKLRRYKDGDQSVIQKIVERQPNLTALDLVNCEGCFDGDDAAFVAVCGLKKLESLKLNIDELNPSVFMENFGQLRQLKALEIESVEHNFTPVVAVVDELSRHKIAKLESLKIYLSDVSVPLDRIERMGKNFGRLKSFTLRCDHPLPLDSYLSNMRELEALNIDFHYTKEFSKLCNNFDVKCSKLKQLSLHGFGFGSDDVNWNELTLLRLTDVFPNVKKLELDAAFPFNTEFIFKIMEKLSSLRVIRNWCMVQSGDNYHKFDQQSVIDLRGIASMLHQFSIELRLKAIDMDVSRVKEDLGKSFNVAMSRFGSFFVLRIVKK